MKRLMFILMVVMLASCEKIKYTESDTLSEAGVVRDAIYTPSRHDTNLMMPLTSGKSGFGIGMDGNFGVHIGSGLMITSTETLRR